MRVELGDRSYEIHIGSKWLDQLIPCLDFIPRTYKLMIISDVNVANLASDRVLGLLRTAGFQVEMAVFPGGEEHKNLSTIMSLSEKMVEAGLDRKSTVIALGGGIVGDVAGFAASIYMRGISYVQIPTTLLAQVDSSVGGKTGVNLPQGKNLIGTFYQPALVFIDVDFVDSLPVREYLTGLAEVLKYGIIWDQDFFVYLEQNIDRIGLRDKECLQHMVSRCCQIKADIVAQDEKENGVRALLNLGHTFGHAFEALTDYRLYNHGEAVAIGIVCASRLSNQIGILPRQDMERIHSLIAHLGLPVSYSNLNQKEIIQQMYKDKKTVGGKLQLVLPTGLGRSQIFSDISETQIVKVLS